MTEVNSILSHIELPIWYASTRSLVTKIDADDYELIKKWKWQKTAHSKGYVRRTALISAKPRKYKTVYLHRLIMNCPDGMEVDHVNGDPLDNRKANLRIVSREQNAQNIGSTKARSGHRGVEINGAGSFVARAQCGDTRAYLGTYKTVEEAANVVSAWRSEHMPYSVETCKTQRSA